MNDSELALSHYPRVTTLAASATLGLLARQPTKALMLKDQVFVRESSVFDEASRYPSRMESEHLLETVLDRGTQFGEDFRWLVC